MNFSTHRNISRQAVNRITFIRLPQLFLLRACHSAHCARRSDRQPGPGGPCAHPTDTRHSGGAVPSSQQQSIKQDFNLLHRRWAGVGLPLQQKHGSSVQCQGNQQEPPPHRGCASKTEVILHHTTTLVVKPFSSSDFFPITS